MTTPMMNKILAGTFGLQVLLAAITWWPEGDTGIEKVDLIAVDASELSSISITGRILKGEVAADPVVLTREADGWTLTSSFGYPASDANLTDLFDQLDKLVLNTPIATQSYSHTPMDVADDQFSRKIEVVTPDGEATTFFLGSAEGKSAHVRVVGQDSVYKVRGVNAFGISDQATRYFDRDFQKVDVDTVSQMTINRPGQAPISFVKDGDTWTLPGSTPPGQEVDQAQAKAFVTTALNFRMLEPNGKQVTPQMGLDAGPVVSWTANDDGSTVVGEYKVGASVPDSTGRRFLKNNSSPFVLEVLEGQLAHAIDRSIDDLFRDPVPVPNE